jgi:hypothetical protein
LICSTGDHWCVRDVYDHAILALKGIAAMHQQEVAPPPRQQLISKTGVIIDLEDAIQTSTEATDLGIAEPPPDQRTSR